MRAVLEKILSVLLYDVFEYCCLLINFKSKNKGDRLSIRHGIPCCCFFVPGVFCVFSDLYPDT